ncbi:helix-turn-helix domain-containing protein [Lysinibacillus fusiformis]|uniref:helix-turn-helix domain-containing protein n=1 Tax=Lysinibacillus fusiformis TaxID=28031 RepID=UPI0037219E7F
MIIAERTMKPKINKVAARLKAIQKENILSLSEMAILLEINKSTLNSYLRGLALPPLPVAEKVMKLCSRGLTVEWFYYGDIVDYIRDYLRFRGHSKFLDRHLNIAQAVYLMYDIATCGTDPFEEVNPTDRDIDIYFERLYRQYKDVYSTKHQEQMFVKIVLCEYLF